ncbi:glutamate receptor U1-like [Macrobrachium nipponense]|uniref:glutamate receptor U1-like n=1 Tax=Macrobrachium nipponense TaxID=159736 RepID=UPI0030C83B86
MTSGGQSVGLRHWRLVLSLMVPFVFLCDARSDAVWRNTTKGSSKWNFDNVQPKFIRYTEPVTLRVAADEWQPHIKVTEDKNGNIQLFGPMAELLESLSYALNFSYTLTRPPDGAWGAPDENGNFNGMLGMIQRNEIDLALGPFGMTEGRARVAAFSRPVVIDPLRITVRRGKPKIGIWNILKPLDWQVWVGTVLAVLFVGAALGLFITTPWTRNTGSSGSLLRQALYQLWDQIATFLGQGMSYIPPIDSSRVVVLMWLLAAFVITRSYQGALTSLLAVREIPIKIDSIEDFLKAKEYRMIYETSTAFTAYLKKSQTGIFRKLHEANLAGRGEFINMNKMPEALDKQVRTRDFAILAEDLTIKMLLSEDFSRTGECGFHISRERFFPLILCVAGNPRLPIMRGINYRIQKIVEHDLYGQTLRRNANNGTSCLQPISTITVNEAYDMASLKGLFYLLCAGFGVSLAAFVVEVILACGVKAV